MSGESLNIPILMYHRIGPRVAGSIVRDQYVSAALFKKHLQQLRKHGYQAISLSEMKRKFDAGETGGRYITITFDDGYESFYSAAMPILKSFGMTATVFLVGNCIGRTNRWDEAKGDVSEPLMNVEQIRDAAKQGMEIGAHTMNHPDLRFCDDSLAKAEIFESKLKTQEMLQVPIEWFSYPYGKGGEREQALVREAGFLGACGTDKHPNNCATDPYDLGRINVRATTFPAYLLHKLRTAARGHG